MQGYLTCCSSVIKFIRPEKMNKPVRLMPCFWRVFMYALRQKWKK